MLVKDALKIVDDDIPDGAWMAMLCDLTGLDASEVACELAALYPSGPKRKRKTRRGGRRHRRAAT